MRSGRAEDLVTDQTELTDRINGEVGARRELVTKVVDLGDVTAGWAAETDRASLGSGHESGA